MSLKLGTTLVAGIPTNLINLVNSISSSINDMLVVINNIKNEKRVKETFGDNKSGYRIWTDGYCEQWGNTGVSVGGALIVTFKKKFIDSDYYLELHGRVANNDTGGTDITQGVICGAAPYDFGQTPAGFRASTQNNSKVKFAWRACGYLAESEYN